MLLQEKASRSSMQKNRTELPFQMTDGEIVEIFSTFNTLGYWLHDLDSGHTYFSDTMMGFFGMLPSDGPVNMMEVAAKLHPDDLSLVMEAHESASVEPMSYRKTHRIRTATGTYLWYCSTGVFRAKEGASGEIVGITWEIPPHRCETVTRRRDVS